MSFADAYLLKAGLRKALIEPEPHPENLISVTIPVYNESGLERCLDSLFLAGPDPASDTTERISFHTEVLILVNAAVSASASVVRQNLATVSGGI